MKDVCRCCTSSTSEDNEDDNILFKDDPDPLLPLWMSRNAAYGTRRGVMESAGGDGGSGEEDGKKEVTPPILCRSTRQRRSPSPCHLCECDIIGVSV